MSSSSSSSSILNSSSQMESSDKLPSKVIRLARKFNRFYLGPFQRNECKPVFFGKYQIGLIRPTVETELSNYPDVFRIDEEKVEIEPGINNEVSAKIDGVLRDIRRRKPNLFVALRGWRDENYEIKANFSDAQPLFKMERSATCIFGFRQYGVDINGYVRHPEKGLCIWFQRRSKIKPTWPGMWDNFVSGGVSEGLGITETAIKEAHEEANVPKDICEKMEPKGCVTFFFESERGIFPQTEFVFDLELSLDFRPSVNDGEVDEFELLPVGEVLSRILAPDMKTTSCPITIDFLVRHGVINPENEPDLPELTELLHIPLHNLYKKKS